MDQKRSKIRVYFTVAAVPDRERIAVYSAVRDAIIKLDYELTYDWLLDENKKSPKEIFRMTTEAMSKADVVIAEVTYPSTGVGQQIAQAAAKKIPVLILKAEWRKPSKFTPGAQSEIVKYVEYGRANLQKLIKENISVMGKERLEKFNLILTPELNAALEKESDKNGISKSQELRQIIRLWMSVNKT